MNTATAAPFERVCWAAAALLAGALLQSIYLVPLGWLPLALISGLVLLAAIQPVLALMVVAIAGPVASMLFWLTGPAYDTRFEEILGLACIVGTATHLAVRPARGPLPTLFRGSARVLLVTALTSVIVVLAGLAATDPSVSIWRYAGRMAASEYLQQPHALFQGLLLIEGVLLSLICAELCARDPRARTTAVLGALLASATLISVLTIVRLVSIATARDNPWTAMMTLIAHFRVSAVHPDLNAAGSYFAMMLCVACGFAPRRWVVFTTVPLMALGLWISGSRTALVACFVIGMVIAVRQSGVRVNRRLAVASAVALVVLLAAGVTWYPQGRNESLRAAALFRIQIAKAALYAVADAPLFGIGGGRFYDESMRYVAASRHPETPLHVSGSENAHNYFLQVAAELGALGLGLFLILVGSGASPASQGNVDRRLAWAVCAGLAVYLATSLVGHPFLVASTAYPFWLLLGVAACMRGSVASSSQWLRWAAAGVLTLMLVSLPFRAMNAAQSANLEHAGVGLSMWQRDEQGIRFRWAGGRSVVYVPADATAVRIPLRHGGQGPANIDVGIFIGGREANRIRLTAGTEWTVVRLLITRHGEARFIGVNLVATSPDSPQPLATAPSESSGALMVGRVEPEGSRY